jgi:hypothetical protein
MLPQNAFLRRLPDVVDAEQALRCEALVFSADSISINYNKLRFIAAKYGERADDFHNIDRVHLFNAAWQIVDQVHCVCLILRALTMDRELSEAAAFCSKFLVARNMRNRMDHLNDNARNRAAAKGPLPPLFGSISYLAVDPTNIRNDADGPQITAATIVSVLSGPLRGSLRTSIVNPGGRDFEPPVGVFRLDAFREVFDIDDVVGALGPLMADINERVERSIRTQAEALARDHGHSVEALLAQPAVGLTLCLKIGFDTRQPD